VFDFVLQENHFFIRTTIRRISTTTNFVMWGCPRYRRVGGCGARSNDLLRLNQADDLIRAFRQRLIVSPAPSSTARNASSAAQHTERSNMAAARASTALPILQELQELSRRSAAANRIRSFSVQ